MFGALLGTLQQFKCAPPGPESGWGSSSESFGLYHATGAKYLRNDVLMCSLTLSLPSVLCHVNVRASFTVAKRGLLAHG